MTKIVADTSAIEKGLRNHVDLLRLLGGWVRDDLIIRCQDGEISLGCIGDGDGRAPLITMPGGCLVPVEQANLRLRGDEIDFDPARSSLPREQACLLDVQCEIYNLTDKTGRTRAALPRFYLSDDSTLLKALSNRRLPKENHTTITPPPTPAPERVLDAFLSSRVLSWPDHGVDGRPTKVLMSLIDYMDHDSGGGRYSRSEDKSTFFVNEGRSRSDQDGCFVRYGPYDAQDFLLAHGFIDTSARFLRSASFECDIEHLGVIRVGGGISIQNGIMTPNRGFDMSWSIPKVTIAEDGALEISSLYIVPVEDRSALRRALTMALVLWRKELSPETMARLVSRVEETVIERTSAYLTGLQALAEQSPNPKGRRAVGELVEFQTHKLAEYTPR
jgi:hypothetical protein